jgi:hypothetical protein
MIKNFKRYLNPDEFQFIKTYCLKKLVCFALDKETTVFKPWSNEKTLFGFKALIFFISLILPLHVFVQVQDSFR